MIKLISPALRRQFAITDAVRSSCLLSVLLVAMIVSATESSSPGQTIPQEGSSAAARDNARTLTPGEIISQKIKGNEAHTFQLMLAPKQYAHIIVEQQGVNLAVSLLDPAGHVLVKADSPNGKRGPEAVSTVAEQAGSYTVEVSANKMQLAGSYELRVEGPREPTPADEKRVAAERAFWVAQESEGDGTADNLDHAIEQYKQALNLWREVGDARGEGYTLCSIGQAYKALRKLPETVDYLNQAVSSLRDAQDIPGQAFALNEMGAAQRDLGDPLQALGHYNQALQLRLSIGDEWGQAQIRNNLGVIYSKIGRQQKAIENFELALPLWRAVGDRGMEMFALNNMAKAQIDMGNLASAFEQFREVSTYCHDTGDNRLEPFVANSLGLIYDTWAESQEALEQYDTALKLFRSAKNKEGEAIVLDNIGMVYTGLGDGQESLRYFQDALKLRRELNTPGGEAVTLSNIGYAQTLLSNYQDALESLNRALSLSHSASDKRFEAYSFVRVGMVYLARNDPKKALESYRQALEIQSNKETEDRRGQAITLDKIGQAYAQLGQLSQAIKSYRQALQQWIAVGDKQGQALSLYGIAQVEMDRKELTDARDRVEEAISLIESLRYKMSSHQLRMTYFAGKQDYYALAIDIRMRLYNLNHSVSDLEEALFDSERARARDLLDILTEAHVDLLNKGMSKPDAERNRHLEQEISILTQNWLRLRSVKRMEDAAAVEDNLSSRIDEQEKILAKLRVANPSDAGLNRPRPLSPHEIQQLLDDDTILLEYSLHKGQSYLWVVTRNKITPYTLAGRDEIEKTAQEFRKSLSAFEPPRHGESGPQYLMRLKMASIQYRQLSLELGRMVLGPLSSQTIDKRLVIVADGALQYIPFEALQITGTDGQLAVAKDYHPIILRREIVYQPSASTFAILRGTQRPQATKTVAVFADPVFDINDERVRISGKGQKDVSNSPPAFFELSRALRDWGDVDSEGIDFKIERLRHSAEEANAITTIAPTGSWMKALGFDASRATVLSQLLSQFRIVHFATHGILNDKHPELSGIVLSMVNEQGKPEDGYLRLGDIYNLNLPIDLAVLSACQTGTGKQVRGEGLLSLTRGFMYAGAAKVVASLWKVDDEATAELMKRFYRQMLEKKMPAATALRQAKLEMMEAREQWRSPFYWAGFVLQGDWR